uniref:Transposase MuDR plant domain-containing protein n=1 Tax=Lactuca sativa TaxID=4236 RepID=A0A9R1VFY4_LACSA|nr:hypothetical protein LSAT_V11C500234480 [Lactuca sativa]
MDLDTNPTIYSLQSDSLESELDVYIDHRNEPILDWADNDFLADGKGYELDELDEEDDKDSKVSMTMEYEHEWDDEDEHTFDKTVGDPFLDKLSGHISDDDEEEANNGKLKDVVFPVHNENQEWEQMVPVLGMKFSNPLELKLCITNYPVENGYDLWYEKSDHERNAIKYAFQEIEGTLKEHYAKTWSYGEEIRRTNPGSTVKMDVDVMPDGTTYFSKFYVCFKGLNDGWIEGCRRVIGLDGCFLKGICRVWTNAYLEWARLAWKVHGYSMEL